eukprot:15432261-Heterocapsa_arctica.AAC.1
MSQPVAPMSRADMPAPADAGEAKNSSQSGAEFGPGEANASGCTAQAQLFEDDRQVLCSGAVMFGVVD